MNLSRAVRSRKPERNAKRPPLDLQAELRRTSHAQLGTRRLLDSARDMPSSLSLAIALNTQLRPQRHGFAHTVIHAHPARTRHSRAGQIVRQDT